MCLVNRVVTEVHLPGKNGVWIGDDGQCLVSGDRNDVVHHLNARVEVSVSWPLRRYTKKGYVKETYTLALERS